MLSGEYPPLPIAGIAEWIQSLSVVTVTRLFVILLRFNELWKVSAFSLSVLIESDQYLSPY